MLKDEATILRANNLEAGLDEGDEVVYEPMKVREWVLHFFAQLDSALFGYSMFNSFNFDVKPEVNLMA